MNIRNFIACQRPRAKFSPREDPAYRIFVKEHEVLKYSFTLHTERNTCARIA